MSVYIPVELRRQIRDHFGGCCAYCKTAESLTVAIFEVEHIVPQSAGGATAFDNLGLACPTCNRYKGSRRLVEDPVTEQMVLLFHPQQQAWKAISPGLMMPRKLSGERQPVAPPSPPCE